MQKTYSTAAAQKRLCVYVNQMLTPLRVTATAQVAIIEAYCEQWRRFHWALHIVELLDNLFTLESLSQLTPKLNHHRLKAGGFNWHMNETPRSKLTGYLHECYAHYA